MKKLYVAELEDLGCVFLKEDFTIFHYENIDIWACDIPFEVASYFGGKLEIVDIDISQEEYQLFRDLLFTTEDKGNIVKIIEDKVKAAIHGKTKD